MDPSVDGPLSVSNNATGCVRLMAFVFADKDRLQSHLPPGFQAFDADGALTGQDRETGLGVVSLVAVRCQASEWQPAGYDEASAGIFVHPPMVANLTATPSNIYEVAHASSPGAQSNNLSQIGWKRFGTKVEADASMAPLPSGSSSVSDDNGTVLSLQIPAAPYAVHLKIHLRNWHDAPEGLGYFESEFETHARLGPGDCWLRPGSLAHHLVGIERCPPGSYFVVGAGFDARGRFAFHEGVRAEA